MKIEKLLTGSVATAGLAAAMFLAFHPISADAGARPAERGMASIAHAESGIRDYSALPSPTGPGI